MARRRPTAPPDPVQTAVLEEADTIERLSGYYMLVCDQPIPGAEGCVSPDEIRALAQKHRGHPAAERVLSTFVATGKMREEVALHG